MSELFLTDKQTKGFPEKGETDFLTPAEHAFVQRILSRPESFPQAFWSAVIQKIALDGQPIPQSQIQGARTGLWEDYTPVWSSTGVTQPSIGNGTLIGRFSRNNKSVTINLFLSGGSTTTWGEVAWKFTPPVPTTASSVPIGVGRAFDDSTGNVYVLGLTIAPDGIFPITAAQPGAYLSPAAPFAWTTADNLLLSVTYEAA